MTPGILQKIFHAGKWIALCGIGGLAAILLFAHRTLLVGLLQGAPRTGPSWGEVTVPGSPPADTPQLEMLGEAVYRVRCLECHGRRGGGDGICAPFLRPRPRNFRTEPFRFTRRGPGAPPETEDVYRTVSAGVPGTAMRSFQRDLTQEERWAVSRHVLRLRGQGLSRRGVPPAVPPPGGPRQDGPETADLLRGIPELSANWSVRGGAENQRLGHQASSAGDVNGDGFGDLIVSAPEFDAARGKIYLYLGSPSGLSSSFSWTAEGEEKGEQFGHQTGGAGDVNGDGFEDFFVTSPSWRAGLGRVCVFFGGPKGPSQRPDWCFHPDRSMEQLGDATAGVGDVNGDGFDDLLVGSYGFDRSRGLVRLFLGGPEGPAAHPVWTERGEARGDQFGYSLCGAGDMDGDGLSDFLVGAKFQCNCTPPRDQSPPDGGVLGGSPPEGAPRWRAPGLEARGKVYLYYGSPTGIPHSGTQASHSQTEARFASTLAGTGDLNGDGFHDFLAGAPGASEVLLFRGGKKRRASRMARLEGKHLGLWQFGSALAPLGDFNGDGTPEFLVSGSDDHGHDVVLVFSPPEGISFFLPFLRPAWKPLARITGLAPGNHFRINTAGDPNGDVLADFVIANEADSSGGIQLAGAVHVIYGRSDVRGTSGGNGASPEAPETSLPTAGSSRTTPTLSSP